MTTQKLEIGCYRDGLTGGYQISIDLTDKDGGGSGYRLSGPKFCGTSSLVKAAKIGRTEADEIRRYLDKVFPAKAEGHA